MGHGPRLGGEGCVRRGQLVAEAVNGDDEPRAETPAQPRDMHVDGTLVSS